MSHVRWEWEANGKNTRGSPYITVHAPHSRLFSNNNNLQREYTKVCTSQQEGFRKLVVIMANHKQRRHQGLPNLPRF
jgi:hypothetical protein